MQSYWLLKQAVIIVYQSDFSINSSQHNHAFCGLLLSTLQMQAMSFYKTLITIWNTANNIITTVKINNFKQKFIFIK
jgi:hypothetical protein